MNDTRKGMPHSGLLSRYLIAALTFCVAFAAAAPPAAAASRKDREKAKQAWEKAQLLKQDLASNPDAARERYLELARTYRGVYYSDPGFFAADDAVFEEGRTYQEIAERFGDNGSLERAARLFRFLLDNYPSSRFRREARERLAALGGPTATASRAEAGADKERAATPTAMQSASAAPPQAAERVSAPGPAVVRSIRYWSTPGATRVSIDFDRPVTFTSSRISDPERLFFDLADATPAPELRTKSIEVGDAFLQRIRMAQNRRNVLRLVLDLNGRFDCSISQAENPFRIVLEIPGRPAVAEAPKPRREPVSAAEAEARKSVPAARGPATAPAPVSAAAVGVESASKLHTVPEGERFTTVKIPESLQAGANAPALPAPAVRLESSLPTAARSGTPLSAERNGKPAASVPLPAIAPAENAVLPKPSAPTSAGDRTLARSLGLKIGRIVIDPGHGGHDMGTVGPDGLMEKDLVLEVARILRRLLEDNLGAEVILTRDEDVFVPLEERTAIANQHRADLFVSIHANSSSSKGTSGVETYFLDFARSAAEREVAARENAAALLNYRDLEGLVWKIARADKMAESRELASTVQKSLYGGARQVFPATRNRGVRSAPFVVLIGAKMPSVLVEVAFLSNPRDEKLLKKDGPRLQLAKALFHGIEGYMKALGSEVVLTQSNGAP
jgi:N-acetylmuramoyl-L-alanine amidase